MSDWDNPNNGKDNWYSEDNLENNVKEENITANENVDDIEPVNLSKKIIKYILIGIALVVFVLCILSVKWFSGGKKNSGAVVDNAKIGISNGDDSSLNPIDKGSKNFDNSGVSEGVSIASTGNFKDENNCNTDSNDSIKTTDIPNNDKQIENTDTENKGNEDVNVQNSDEQENKDDNDIEKEFMKEVDEPELGEKGTTSSVVASKQIFTVKDTCYAYLVNLVVLTKNNDAITLQYFCPRKTYDALSKGESVNIEYQRDSDGRISIISVYK